MSERILILDDELSYANMVGDLLTENGYQADICTHPRDALERLNERSYGLVVSDFKMPDINGAELLSDIRRLLPDIPVIMISGLMSKPDLIRVANIGVNVVLEKPFKVPVFLDHVARFVKSSKLDELHDALREPENDDGSDDALAYPRPLKHAIAEIEPSRRFFGQLWKSLQNHVHTLVVVPPGGEFVLLARECAEWLGDAADTIHHFSYGELAHPETRSVIKRLSAAPGGSRIVALSHADSLEFDPALFESFLRWTYEDSEALGPLKFLHALPDVPEVRRLQLSADIAGTVESPLVLAPLRERLVDLSGYAERILEAMPEEQRRPFTAEAVAVLLNYEWPGNYLELRSVLRRAIAFARRGDVSARAVRLAIEDRHGDVPAEGTVLDLGAFLQREQKRFFHVHVHPRDGLEGVARLVGDRSERLVPDLTADAQPLLFPELTQTGASR